MSMNTNIVNNPRDGFFYMMAARSGSVLDKRNGMCVLRTRNLSDPTSWRAWNGSSFSVSMVNPYTLNKTGGNPRRHLCALVADTNGHPLRFSLSYNTFLKSFLLLGTCNCRWTDSTPDCSVHGKDGHGEQNDENYDNAFCFSLSHNLIDWSDHHYVMNITSIMRWKEGGVPGQWYPSLIDPTSQGRNFEYSGQTPYIYYTYFHTKVKQNATNRDLWRSQIKFTV